MRPMASSPRPSAGASPGHSRSSRTDWPSSIMQSSRLSRYFDPATGSSKGIEQLGRRVDPISRTSSATEAFLSSYCNPVITGVGAQVAANAPIGEPAEIGHISLQRRQLQAPHHHPDRPEAARRHGKYPYATPEKCQGLQRMARHFAAQG